MWAHAQADAQLLSCRDRDRTRTADGAADVQLEREAEVKVQVGRLKRSASRGVAQLAPFILHVAQRDAASSS